MHESKFLLLLAMFEAISLTLLVMSSSGSEIALISFVVGLDLGSMMLLILVMLETLLGVVLIGILCSLLLLIFFRLHFSFHSFFQFDLFNFDVVDDRNLISADVHHAASALAVITASLFFSIFHAL